MSVPRPFALLQSRDQWRRSSHQGTVLLGGAVQLDWLDGEPGELSSAAPPAAGLAFDPWCRLYHSLPEEGRVERLLWAAGDPTEPLAERPEPLALFADDTPHAAGDFAAAEPAPAALRDPRGLAVDDAGRLFVAEAGARRVLVYDLWRRRLLRRVRLAGRPYDLATDGRRVWAAVEDPAGLVALTGRGGPRALSGGVDLAAPAPWRLAAAPGQGLFLLDAAGAVVCPEQPGRELTIDGASDLELVPAAAGDGWVLVAAGGPGDPFRRFALTPGGYDDLPPLKARGYDGRGIVRTPDGRLGFWTARGFRHAVAARLRYRQRGRVSTFALDGGSYQCVWGRLFLDACIPAGTEVRCHCATADEPEGEPVAPEAELPQTLHRRETGCELPWSRAAEPFATYEAPVLAPPGRYLWLSLELRGNSRSTPRLRGLRVEHPGHELLRHLPRAFSREARAADFLRRYLAIFDGALGDLDARATARRALLDPASTPAELLGWLAGFVGLVLDERWPLAARRTAVAEATWLFRFRGTVPGLRRFLEIYLGEPVILIEHFRLRGLGGAIVGADVDPASRPIVGAGFRVGGAVGKLEELSAAGKMPPADAFETRAHRFSVVVPRSLDHEQLAVVEHLLDLHRPAHTVYDLCTLDTGMRLGVALYAGLTSIVGRGAGFTALRLDASCLGRNAVVGQPMAGTRAGGSRLGGESRMG